MVWALGSRKRRLLDTHTQARKNVVQQRLCRSPSLLPGAHSYRLQNLIDLVAPRSLGGTPPNCPMSSSPLLLRTRYDRLPNPGFVLNPHRQPKHTSITSQRKVNPPIIQRLLNCCRRPLFTRLQPLTPWYRAALTGGFVDRIAETKGMDALDKERAKHAGELKWRANGVIAYLVAAHERAKNALAQSGQY